MKFHWQSRNCVDIELRLGDDVIGGIKPFSRGAGGPSVEFQTWTIWASDSMMFPTVTDASIALWAEVEKRYRLIADEAERQRNGVFRPRHDRPEPTE